MLAFLSAATRTRIRIFWLKKKKISQIFTVKVDKN